MLFKLWKEGVIEGAAARGLILSNPLPGSQKHDIHEQWNSVFFFQPPHRQIMCTWVNKLLVYPQVKYYQLPSIKYKNTVYNKGWGIYRRWDINADPLMNNIISWSGYNYLLSVNTQSTCAQCKTCLTKSLTNQKNWSIYYVRVTKSLQCKCTLWGINLKEITDRI